MRAHCARIVLQSELARPFPLSSLRDGATLSAFACATLAGAPTLLPLAHPFAELARAVVHTSPEVGAKGRSHAPQVIVCHIRRMARHAAPLDSRSGDRMSA